MRLRALRRLENSKIKGEHKKAQRRAQGPARDPEGRDASGGEDPEESRKPAQVCGKTELGRRRHRVPTRRPRSSMRSRIVERERSPSAVFTRRLDPRG